MLMPKNNLWALIGAGGTTVLVFVLSSLLQFFVSGTAWPVTTQGWLQIILPSLVAGLLAALTPYYEFNRNNPSLPLPPFEPKPATAGSAIPGPAVQVQTTTGGTITTPVNPPTERIL